MKKIILSFLLIVFSQFLNAQNIQLQPTTAVGAVDNLIAGGINPTGQTFTTNPNTQLRLFNNGQAAVGFNSGVVLSTANLGANPNILGPGNNLAGAGTPGTNLFQQAGITNATTNNAAVLTFSFVPVGDVISFNYVFASNEYNTFVGSGFNDVFAFLLTGPNPAGGNYNNTNIAIIPGTTNTPVSINTVNNGSACPPNGPCNNCQFYVNNCNGNNIPLALRGLTVPLTATANVIPCETYTIRLAVADVQDGSFNSVVFLEANSFTSPNLVGVSNPINGNSNSNSGLWESCGFTTICFSRNYQIGLDKWFFLNKGGTSIEGINYSNLPDSILIQSGDSTICIDVEILWDQTSQNNTQLILTIVDSLCVDFPLSASVTIDILNVEPLQLNIENFTTGCPTDTINIIPNYSGGAGDLIFNWSNGSLEYNIIVYNEQPGEYLYTLTITDECNLTISDNSIITVLNGVESNFTFNNQCEGFKVDFLNNSNSDSGEDLSYIWNINGNTYTNENISLIFNQSSNYSIELISFYIKDGILCSDTLVDTLIIYPTPDATFYSPNGEPSLINNNINFQQFNSNNTETWTWLVNDIPLGGNSLSNFFTINQIGNLNVTLIATSEWGCFDIWTNIWNIQPIEMVWIPNSFTPNSDSFNNEFKIEAFYASEVNIKIWNRWGELVFQTNNIDEGWNGKFRGQDCKVDVYVYQIDIVDIWGKWNSYKGKLNLIR